MIEVLMCVQWFVTLNFMHARCYYCSGSVKHEGMNRNPFINKLPVKQGSDFNFTNELQSLSFNTIILKLVNNGFNVAKTA